MRGRLPIVLLSSNRCIIVFSHDLHRSYVRLHEEARKYKKEWRIRAEKAHKNNRPVKEPQEVEMNNFQDPQVNNFDDVSLRVVTHADGISIVV